MRNSDMSAKTGDNHPPNTVSASGGHGHGHVGRSTVRAEDILLVNGRGGYLADLPHEGAYEIAFVRSSFAHARILGISARDALKVPGVLCVVTGQDLADLAPMPVIWRQEGLRIPAYRALAHDTVHHVGQPVAAVVARTRELAEDAAELVDVDYDDLRIVTDPAAALAPDAPILHPEFGGNEAYRRRTVTGDVDACFAEADLVVEETLEVQRQTALPMEGRGILVRPRDERGGITISATLQHPHLFRDHIAEMFGLAPDTVRVHVPDLGGAFGAYYEVYPEEVTAIWVALRYGVGVRWLEDRQESFLSTVHARQQRHRVSLALRGDGRILALRDEILTDIGAYVDYSGVGPSYLTSLFMTGPYDIRNVDVGLVCAFTNKVRSGAYRGFGQPEATFVLERVIDIAAARLGMDPVDLRAANLIGPERFPYVLATGPTMDSADLPKLLSTLVEAVDYHEVRTGQAARAGRKDAGGAGGAKRLGVGIALYTEFTGSSPSASLGKRGYDAPGWECVTIEVRRDGGIRALSGVSHFGQGARTALSQIAADRLGVTPADVTVVSGDTERVRHGNRGSVGSRSAVIAGQAMNKAATELAGRIRLAAADLLEADPEDIRLADRRAFVAGSPSQAISFADLSAEVYKRHRTNLDADPVLEATAFYDPADTPFGSGAHAAVVEVDTETGRVDVLRYVIVHDCGTVINPAIVEGQVLGGAAQGVGGALLEELVYEETGQLRSGTMMDYLIPTASEMPPVRILHRSTPSPLNPLGVKGAGEAGTVGPGAALANAVSDALGAQVRALPLSPLRVWELAHADAAGSERSRR
ncbi:molybdopterin cofactor-binding domain-containing protein [Streptosporangium sp. NPDC051022]|uniref:xanthine dehydrogenase family protein molybdopterin-binding subunit n=1 Tax=Streptosporangium sp. NPDC051022 TaxID=3155752 RepID=UPI003429D6FC